VNISKLAFFVVLSLFVNRADAMNISDYESLKEDDRDVLEIYIRGVGAGVLWTQAVSEEFHNVKIYCPPAGLKLNPQNHINIIDNMLESRKPAAGPFDPDTPVEMLLVLGLKKTFPCE